MTTRHLLSVGLTVILLFLLWGLNKGSVVAGPIYVIALGVLLLFAQIPFIPTPALLTAEFWSDDE